MCRRSQPTPWQTPHCHRNALGEAPPHTLVPLEESKRREAPRGVTLVEIAVRAYTIFLHTYFICYFSPPPSPLRRATHPTQVATAVPFSVPFSVGVLCVSSRPCPSAGQLCAVLLFRSVGRSVVVVCMGNRFRHFLCGYYTLLMSNFEALNWAHFRG